MEETSVTYTPSSNTSDIIEALISAGYIDGDGTEDLIMRVFLSETHTTTTKLQRLKKISLDAYMFVVGFTGDGEVEVEVQDGRRTKWNRLGKTFTPLRDETGRFIH